MLCSVESFDRLHSGRRLSAERTIDLIVTTARRSLTKPNRRRSRRR
jgi:hypothetical protein